MAVKYQSKSEVKVASGTSITIPISIGWSVGDLLICCITKDDDYEITPPAGWTVIQNINSGTAMRLWTGYRIAQAGDTDWTWSGDSEAYYGVILLYSGASATPIHGSGNQIGTGYNITAPSVAFTNLTAGSLILQVFGADRNGWEFTIPPQLTERFKDYITGAGGCGGGGGDKSAEGWVSPTGFVDPDSQWSTEENAYDQDVGVGSHTSLSIGTWGSYLELTHSAISCSKVWLYVRCDETWVSSISIDVFYSDAWHNIFEGAVTDREWVEKAIGSTQTVTAMRIKCRGGTSAGYGWIYEAAFNDVNATVLTGNTCTAVFTQTASEEWVGVTAVIEAAVVESGLIDGYFMQDGVKEEMFGYFMNSIEEFGYYMNPTV